jgi:hypothetical protein
MAMRHPFFILGEGSEPDWPSAAAGFEIRANVGFRVQVKGLRSHRLGSIWLQRAKIGFFWD